MRAGFTFHAAPPPGQWFNDPNGLCHAGGHYRLFAQHGDGAAPKEIGWGTMVSDDLLDWRWAGVALPPADGMSAYSGSVVAVDPIEAFATRHCADATPQQTQWRAVEAAGGLAFDDAALKPAGRNVRDPFVFRHAATGDWRMLLAEPCDWHAWRDEGASTLSVWASPDKCHWSCVGTIGPWDAPGVMWEVPVLIDAGDAQLLLISTVDRRDGGAACAVVAHVGQFDGAKFTATHPPAKVDLGPDFYAACVNTLDGWPDDARVLVGWASNWATARTMPWPGGVHGGPIALPRVVTVEGGHVGLRPIAAALPRAARTSSWQPGEVLTVTVAGDAVALTVTIDAAGQLTAVRQADDAALVWRSAVTTLDGAGRVTVFVDAGLVEVFVAPQGLAMTVFVPGGTLQEERA